MDEGRKRVLLIAASILAARKLAQFDGRAKVPATVSAIADAVRWAEEIMKAISGVATVAVACSANRENLTKVSARQSVSVESYVLPRNLAKWLLRQQSNTRTLLPRWKAMTFRLKYLRILVPKLSDSKQCQPSPKATAG